MLVWIALAWAVDVVVEEMPGKDRWSVVWEVDEPVRGLLFTRNRNPIQADFKAKGAKIRELDQHQVLLLPKGKTATRFEASFRTNTDYQSKDYELNIAFGDGARMLYTDHLFVVALSCPSTDDCTDDELVVGQGAVHDFRFATDDDRYVLTPDGRTKGTGAWSQRSQGVYIYFGQGEPLPDERVNFLVDPTLPPWVVARSKEWVGPLFDHYTAQTGRELSFTPVVLLSYNEGEDGQLGYGGGGLPGQMQLQLNGKGWATENDETREVYARFLAHETFHMWNGQELQTYLGPSEEWLSEGSADLFSLWALEELGVLDEDAVAQRSLGAAAQCAGDLRGQPLLTAHQRGSYRAFYTCGATGLLQLHHTLSESGGLPAAFQRVFAEGNGYSTYDLLEAAHAQSKDPLATAFLERLLRQGLGEEPAEQLARAFTAGGLPAETADTWTVEGLGDRAYHSALMATIGACDCGGSVSAWNRGEMVEFDAIEPCDQLRDGMKVRMVAGGPWSPRRAALARAWTSIDADGTLLLGDGEGGTKTLQCEAVRRPRALVGAGSE